MSSSHSASASQSGLRSTSCSSSSSASAIGSYLESISDSSSASASSSVSSSQSSRATEPDTPPSLSPSASASGSNSASPSGAESLSASPSYTLSIKVYTDRSGRSPSARSTPSSSQRLRPSPRPPHQGEARDSKARHTTSSTLRPRYGSASASNSVTRTPPPLPFVGASSIRDSRVIPRRPAGVVGSTPTNLGHFEPREGGLPSAAGGSEMQPSALPSPTAAPDADGSARPQDPCAFLGGRQAALFLHAFPGNNTGWERIFADELGALGASPLTACGVPVYVGFPAGFPWPLSPDDTPSFLSPLERTRRNSTRPYEEVFTVAAMYEHCERHPNTLVAYLHDKGTRRGFADEALARNQWDWRKLHEYFVLEVPQGCVAALAAGEADMCGANWKSSAATSSQAKYQLSKVRRRGRRGEGYCKPSESPPVPNVLHRCFLRRPLLQRGPHYAGNFWCAGIHPPAQVFSACSYRPSRPISARHPCSSSQVGHLRACRLAAPPHGL